MTLQSRLKDIFAVLPNTGVLPEDNDSAKLNKRFLNSMALLMSTGGIIWGTIGIYFELYGPAVIPLSYTALTGINLLVFHFTKKFRAVSFFQVLISLLLPFLFQWSLGGLLASGGMMLWAFLALVGSMSFQDTKRSIRWLIFYVLLVVFSGFIDSQFMEYDIGLTQKTQMIFFIVNIALISTIIFTLMLYFISSRNKANANLQKLTETLEDKVKDRTAQLQSTNDKLQNLNQELQATINQVQEQHNMIEAKNKSITDSLNYARRIQRAILSKSDEACDRLNEVLLFFKPRDIVSGDFYWFHCDSETDKFVAAVVDCTGHGVPGAFMSLIGDALLNQIVIDHRELDPQRILEEMNKGVEHAMTIEGNHQRDGMDMAILVIDQQNHILEYAGAKSPLVYMKNGSLQHIKGSKHPIGGGHYKKEKSFQKHTIHLNEETMLYMFSDGFPDQFGGDKKRKYLTSRFRAFLSAIAHLPVHEQKKRLDEELKNWRGNIPQTDDVLVAGFKIKAPD